MLKKINYPDWIHCNYKSLMDIPKPYLEYFVRWYYYDHSEDSAIPDTIPVENIEDYIVEHMNAQNLWCAKGFAIARNVDEEKDNLAFKNDSEFIMVIHFVAKLWFKAAIENDWISKDITKEDFKKECHILRYGGSTYIHFQDGNMILYALYETHTDGCTWSCDEMIEVFHDETLAEYFAIELNADQEYNRYFVKPFASLEKLSNLEIEERITYLRNRNK